MTTTAERTTLKRFISINRITADVEWTDHNPHMAEADYMTRHFRVTLRRGRKRMTVYFSQGSAHEKEPTASDVLDCLASDAAGFANAQSFEDWASEYGYDTDSRKAERTYKTIERQAGKLEAFLGPELNEQLLWNTERE